MSFSASCFYYRLAGTALLARCQDSNGNEMDASLDFNTVLTNHEGTFDTNITNFSHSAAKYGLNDTTLVARLARTDRSWCDASIDLNTVVKNNEGNLERA
ncbi:Cyanovirin-N [Mycena rebaudengoi]|nr:Cyanovirin-N [Mycena rebaudengoi]